MLIRRKLLYLVVGSSTSLLILAGGSWWSLEVVRSSFAEVTGITGPRQIAALESRQAGTDLTATMAQISGATEAEALQRFGDRAVALAKQLDPGDHSLTDTVGAALAADRTLREAERTVAARATQLRALGQQLQRGLGAAATTIKGVKQRNIAVNEASLQRANRLTEQVAELGRIASRIERIRLNSLKSTLITSRFKLAVPSATIGEALDDLARRNLGIPDFDKALAGLIEELRSSLLGEQGALPLRKAALAAGEAERPAALDKAQAALDKAQAQMTAFDTILATAADDLSLANRQAIARQQTDHEGMLLADQTLETCQDLNSAVQDLLQAVLTLERAMNTTELKTAATTISARMTTAQGTLPRFAEGSVRLTPELRAGVDAIGADLKKLSHELTGSSSLEAGSAACLGAKAAAVAARAQQQRILADLAQRAEAAAAEAASVQGRAVTKVERTTAAATAGALAMAGSASILALFIGWLVTRQISQGLHEACVALERDDGQRLQVRGNDEIARLTKALNATIDRIAGNRDQVLNKALALAQTADHMGGISDGLAANVATAEREAGSVASAAETAASAVASVATAAEELSASVQEIAKAAGNAADASHQALATAQATSAALSRLAQTAQEIAEAAQTINGIAKQTNLLALNATIEATRAGEAGLGFAVVAQEVKALARKAGEAAQNIGTLLATIDAEATSSTQAMEQAVAAAGRINEFTGSIAAAVEQQAATTNEISRVAHDAAQATGAAAAGVQRVAGATASVAASGQDTRATAQALAHLAEDLKALTKHG